MKNLKKVINEIKKAKTIIIASHVNPDGDTIGSLLSLGLGLKKLKKKVYMVSQDGVPARFKSLPGADKIKRTIDCENIDLAISVDCSSVKILGNTYEIFKKAGKIIEIDHHDVREKFGDITLNEPKYASVGEIIYEILAALNVKITKEIAENILTSVIVETNSFKLPNVTPHSLYLTGELVEIGIDFYKLVDRVFWSKSKEGVLLTGICLSRCKFLHNDKIVWSIIRKEDFEGIKGKDEDIDPVASDMISIMGVEIAVLFRENRADQYRVSLRSKDKINVAKLAEKFGGGGHFDIAGCEIPNTEYMIDEVLKEAKKLL